MSITLRDLLGRFRALDRVEIAAIVAHDGLLIESSARAGVEVEAVCAVASNALVMAEALGREIDKGGQIQTVLEYEDGLVVLEPLNADAMLLVVTGSREQLGRLRLMAARHREDFLTALRAND